MTEETKGMITNDKNAHADTSSYGTGTRRAHCINSETHTSHGRAVSYNTILVCIPNIVDEKKKLEKLENLQKYLKIVIE